MGLRRVKKAIFFSFCSVQVRLTGIDVKNLSKRIHLFSRFKYFFLLVVVPPVRSGFL